MESVERVFPKGLPAAVGPYSPVTVIGSTVYVSGQIPINPESGNIEAQDIEGQTHQVMKNLKNALAGVGLTFNDVAKCQVLLADMSFFGKFNAVYAEYFEKDKYPARVCYAVKGLPKDSLVEVDAIAHKAESSIKKKVHENE